MKLSNNKTVSFYEEPRLALIRNLPKQIIADEKKAEQANKHPYKKWKMPEQPVGYLKNRKHDCL
jgi:hypothetical protein